MSTEKPVETIQTLLVAEEEAKKLVEQARKDRDARLKKAATEAETEISDYRRAKEEEYQAQVKSVSGSTTETSEKIASDAKQNIKSIINSAKSKKSSVIDMLVSFVRNVNTTA